MTASLTWTSGSTAPAVWTTAPSGRSMTASTPAASARKAAGLDERGLESLAPLRALDGLAVLDERPDPARVALAEALDVHPRAAFPVAGGRVDGRLAILGAAARRRVLEPVRDVEATDGEHLKHHSSPPRPAGPLGPNPS